MKRKVLGLAFILCMFIIFAASVNAEEVTQGYLTFDTDTGTIIKCESEVANDIVIPSEIAGVAVTKIGVNAFNYVRGLNSITLPNSLIEIEDYAFQGCYFKNIEIPDSVTKIGNNAFSACFQLEEITLSNNLTAINPRTFHSCTHLKQIYIPKSVSQISGEAFTFCDVLESINVDKDNPYYKSEDGICYNKDQTAIIRYPSSLSTGATYIIPSNITQIGDYAFAECKFSDIVLHSDIGYIGKGAFSNCKNIKSVELPDKVNELNSNLFYYCSNISSVKLPSYLTAIGKDVFNGCYKLDELTIPEGVTVLSDLGQNSVSILYLPSTIEYVEEFAAQAFTNLTDVYYNGTKTQWDDIQMEDYNFKFKTARIHYVNCPFIDTVNITKNNENYIISAQISGVSDDCLLITVLYSGSKTTGIKTTPLVANDTQKTVTIADDNATKAKVFIWNSLSGMRPLCEAKEVDI